jgi:sporulation protein YlmC with PRC-barrel domain
VLRAVFRPDDYALVGYLIARPDLLFMFKRKDRFLAWDAFRVLDGRVVATIDRDSWDEPACKRLGIDWDSCLILEGMMLVTSDGEKVGLIDAVDYDERSGKAIALRVGDGATARTLIGTSRIPMKLIVGYRDGRMVAERAAGDISAEGGLAAKAGEQTAVAAQVVKEKTAKARKVVRKASAKAGKAADQALDSGSRALGKQLGRTRGMFKAFRDEYKKGRGK